MIISIIVNHLNIQFTPPGASGNIQFRLAWNPAIAGVITVFTVLLTYLSALFVMKSKSKVKLIDLIGDSGA